MACALLIACGGDDAGTAPDAVVPDARLSDNATLAALTATAGVLDPPFDAEVAEYRLVLGETQAEVRFIATAAVPAATWITIDGAEVASGEASPSLLLGFGVQDVDIVATAASGDARTYRIHVQRGVPGIELSHAGGVLPDRLIPAFASGTTSYAVAVGVAQQRVQLRVIPPVAGSTVVIDSTPVTPGAPSPPLALELGLTSIAVAVTEPGAAPITYTVAVTRGGGLAQDAYVKAVAPAADDRFGSSIALWGDTLVVGAPAEGAGAVHVLTRAGASWSSQAHLTPWGGGAGDRFGGAVALWGDTLAVAAIGAVHVFTRSGGTWSPQAELDVATSDQGRSVALWGDTLVVGAMNEDSAAGAAYVFARTGTTWTPQARLEAASRDAGDRFGTAVAVWGNTVAVGADGDNSGEGAVYVFTRTGATWPQQAYLQASAVGAGDKFGRSVALWGDTLAVGAPFEDDVDEAVLDSGAAYVLTRAGAIWSHQRYLKADAPGVSDLFGEVALSGDVLAVGASQEDGSSSGTGGSSLDDGAPDAGAVWMYTRAFTTWSQLSYVKASNTDPDDRFGSAVALWGDTVAIGAVGESSSGAQDDDSLPSAGAVYVLR